MKPSCNNSISLSQAPEGPLSTNLDFFKELLMVRGYAQQTVYSKARLSADFNRWLGEERIPLHDLTELQISSYLQYRRHLLRPRSDDNYTLKQLINMLQENGAIDQNKQHIEVSPLDQLTEEYTLYLQQTCRLAVVTIRNYVFFIRRFIRTCFSDEEVPNLSHLCAAHIVEFVQCQAKSLHLKRAKLMTTALRSFLRFGRFRGDIKIDLAAAVPTVANWTMSSIPRAISTEHVQIILSSCKRQTTIGCRDYAILLLLARLGLRASEIVMLTLDDIDWEAGLLKVIGKRGDECPLPIPVDVGEAIATYLQTGRPHCHSRRVFLRSKAPIRGFSGPSSICTIMRAALKHGGIDIPCKGTHQFRHGLACELLRQGASLTEIGELLRHRSPTTTALYAKVDLVALRELALPWPGEVK